MFVSFFSMCSFSGYKDPVYNRGYYEILNMFYTGDVNKVLYPLRATSRFLAELTSPHNLHIFDSKYDISTVLFFNNNLIASL
jgi:hypothetical protein